MKYIIGIFVIAVFFIPVVSYAQAKVNSYDIIEQINKGEPVKYENAVITGDLDLTDVKEKTCESDKSTSISSSFLFWDITLKRTKRIYYCHIEQPVSFIKCTFNGKLITHKKEEYRKKRTTLTEDFSVRFHKNVKFENCEFKEKADFINTGFDKSSVFNNSRFLGKAMFNYASFSETAGFTGTYFKKKVSFRDAEFLNGSSFKNIKFSGDVSFSGAEFLNGSDFFNTIFEKNAVFDGSRYSAGVNFDKVQFNGGTGFRKTEFCEPVNLAGTSARKNVDFTRAVLADTGKGPDKNKLPFSWYLADNRGKVSDSFREKAKSVVKAWYSTDFKGTPLEGCVIRSSKPFDEFISKKTREEIKILEKKSLVPELKEIRKLQRMAALGNSYLFEDKINFWDARAEISSAGGQWKFNGRLEWLKKERLLVGTKAVLVSPEGEKIEGEKIRLSINDPAGYEIIKK